MIRLESPGSPAASQFADDVEDEEPDVHRRNLLVLFRVSGESEETWNIIATLCYVAHGGSGFGFTRADVLDMELAEAIFLMEQLKEFRDEEARAIKAASKGRSS